MYSWVSVGLLYRVLGSLPLNECLARFYAADAMPCTAAGLGHLENRTHTIGETLNKGCYMYM